MHCEAEMEPLPSPSQEGIDISDDSAAGEMELRSARKLRATILALHQWQRRVTPARQKKKAAAAKKDMEEMRKRREEEEARLEMKAAEEEERIKGGMLKRRGSAGRLWGYLLEHSRNSQPSARPTCTPSHYIL